MNEHRERLEQHLHAARARLDRLAGVEVLDDNGAAAVRSFADPMDAIQATESLELGFATRELLATRVNRLATAVERVDRGEYGACVECGGEIAAARLRALPDVETCVECQDRRERCGSSGAMTDGSIEAPRKRRTAVRRRWGWERIAESSRSRCRVGC